MKKILFSTALLLGAATAANAQLWTSVDLGYNSGSGSSTSGTTTTDAPKTTNFKIMPTFGYSLNETFMIGLGVGYMGNTMTEESVSGKHEHKEGTFNVMPFVRYNKGINDNFGCYGQLDVNLGSGTTKHTDTPAGGTASTEDGKVSTLGVNLRPGVYYQFSDHFSMNAHYGSLGYGSRTETPDTKVDYETKATSFGLNLGMSTLGFGLNYHF